MSEHEASAPTKYCAECGEKINAKAEICPGCGVRQPDAPDRKKEEDMDKVNQYTALGIVTGIIAFWFLPIVFGPLSIICGYQILRHGRPTRGILIMAFGAIAFIVGWIIGALFMLF